MLVGKSPFYDASEYLVFKRIVRNNYSFPDKFPDYDAKDLIKKFLHAKQDHRLGSRAIGGSMTVKTHAFFAPIKWDKLVDEPSPLSRYYKTTTGNADATDNAEVLENW
jgi:3-phosphoinositide dependent protein kinase-1